MSTARYWRIVALAAYGGGDLRLSALHLYGPSGRVDEAAAISCSHVPVAGAIADLQDSDPGAGVTFSADQVRSGGFWLAWDFGVAGADVSTARPGSAAAQNTYLKTFVLQSLSASGWITQAYVDDIAWPGANALAQLVQISDPYDAQTVFLLGSRGGQPYDASASAIASVTSVGAVAPAQTLADGFAFAGGHINAGPASVLSLGAGDWCVEGYAMAADFPRYHNLFDSRIGGAAGIGVYVADGGMLAYTDNASVLLLGNRAAQANTPFHWAAERVNGVVTLYLNGQSSGSVTDARTLAAIGSYGIGDDEYNQPFLGEIAGPRVTLAARYQGTFTPSPLPLRRAGYALVRSAVPQIATVRSQGVVAVAAPIPGAVGMIGSRAALARDVEFGGAGRIFGTTKTKATPTNLPTKARVVLLHQRSKLLVRETWSDPDTGGYSFDGLDVRQEFLALAEDAAGNFRAVAAQRLLPGDTP
ncbi:hypothetical protein [Delftia tsuruhatensis]|uniref:hypothetical protein n=1 Tax=Delftia tsuruhatensis TaxID=180282 RepID=UPI0030D396CD